ncbi:site-specific recombinase, DNA invertase Pin [Terriglobus roseus DSM 18391]|uniref:Site-specific recombinase, DNA invertase Pin n=1 Tax=Terriglobus roseus (strain DSM 18391 / NRRL B-41598 / KBS 63) TaxID=926566 RepID=I3ZJ93_TERRK|nr:recombinase family protein [Terriglobus roseus]AFL89311.1 site-specific recombinase, DNA invertase Pin [Terriglobus roseus DSM 18391]
MARVKELTVTKKGVRQTQPTKTAKPPRPAKPAKAVKSARPTKGQCVGYIRVSTLDQREDRQLEGVTVDRRFVDRVSGKDVKRPQLTAMLSFVREGDTVVCHSMDRLGRNLDDLRKLVFGLTERGVRVEFRKENLIFIGEDSPMANLLLSVMGAIAEFERQLIRERQREGIELAKKRGVYKGRPRTLSAEVVVSLVQRFEAGEKPSVLAREFGVSRMTLHRYRTRAIGAGSS